MAVLTWVPWFDHNQLYGPIGNILPTKYDDPPALTLANSSQRCPTP